MAATATVDHRTDAERLRAQARALQNAADKLSEERMELLRESWAFEAEADRLEKAAPAPVVVVPKTPDTNEHDTALMTRVVEFMASLTGDATTTTAEIADHMTITQTRARTVLARLERIGMVTRVGIKSATRYRLTTVEEAPTPAPATAAGDAKVHEIGNYGTAVRDAAIGLGVFDVAELSEALPDMAEGTVRRWLASMVADGMFESERIDGRNIYAYRRPKGDTRARPRRATPEAEATRELATHRGGSAVAGTGRVRVGTPVVDALIREVAPYGVTVTFSKHRVEYRKDGRIIATSSKTPGASHLGGTRKQLRDAGVPV